MVITITSLRLKSLWQFFQLSYLSVHIVIEMRKSKGFIKFRNKGFGYMHYTISAWETEDDLKQFAYRGNKHTSAMKKSSRIASEIMTYTYLSDNFPDWKTALPLLKSKGRLTKIKS